MHSRPYPNVCYRVLISDDNSVALPPLQAQGVNFPPTHNLTAYHLLLPLIGKEPKAQLNEPN